MNDLVKETLKNKGKVQRFLYEGKWADIGRLEDYQKIQSEFS